MNESHDKVEALLNQALTYKANERAAFLTGACGGDPDLQEKVETLLRAAEEAEGFMEGITTMDDSAFSEGPGTVIGRYKLLQKVGEGGMGAVYMAEQTEPMTRKVALKIIKLGMDTRQVVARFEAERQALAMMDHPNIAKVLDAGTTDHGRPFFVMELVQGVPITEFCDKNKLSAQDRLELFIPVCQSILSAHQKGIIHRDIKPSNVLVTLHHGIPMAKVIDFGIAKAINQKLTEKTLFTHYATMIGTPAYMSPEQAEMSSMDVDTRTDVYSLGVLLYELLTGTTPFPEKRLRSMGYGEMQKVIAEEEPMKPSTCLSTMQNEERKTVSQCRGLDIKTLSGQLKGDLDWIVMKCLEKDRRRRYDTPKELVEDLQRHLNNEPVSAAAPTFAYQLQKFYRRNRVQMRVIAGAAALLLLATLFSMAMAFVANKAKKDAQDKAIEAESAKKQAEQESIRGDLLARTWIQFLDETLPGMRDDGNSSSALSFLDQADRLAESMASLPASECELRYALLKYNRYLTYQFDRAVKQGNRLETLLNQLEDAELPAPRYEIECDILSSRLFDTKTEEPEFEILVQAVKALAQKALSEPEKAGDATARCYTTLASVFFHSDLNHRAMEELIQVRDMLVGFPHSWVGPYAQFTYLSLKESGHMPDSIPPPWVEPQKLPTSDWQFKNRYHQVLEVKFRYLLKKHNKEEMERFLAQTLQKFRIANWITTEATSEPHLELLRVDLLMSSERWGEAQAVLKLLFDGLEGDFIPLMNAFERASLLPNLELYEDMRLTMLSLYLSHLHSLHANRLAKASVTHPLPADLAKMVERSLDAVSRVNTNEPQRADQYLSRALIAYHQGQFERALDLLNTFANEASRSPVGARLLARRDREWDWRMVKVMTLLQLGEHRYDEALVAYYDGLEVRKKNAMEEQFIDQDIFLHQAEKALKERNLIP